MVREVELFQYFPAVIQGIQEFQEIAGTESSEFNKLFLNAQARLSDSFIREATSQGIKRYEKMLGLASVSRLTLEERRTKVLINWNRQLPYTLRRLTEQLALWSGNEAFMVDISRFKEYELRIEIFNQTLAMLQEIKEMTGEMIPANLLLFLYGRYSSKYNVPARYENAVHIQTAFHPRYNLPYLLLDRTWKLDASCQLNGYASDDILDFYPVRLWLRAEVAEDILTGEQIRFVSGSGVEVETESILSIRNEAEGRIRTGERVEIRSTVGIETAIGTGLHIVQEAENEPLTESAIRVWAEAAETMHAGVQIQTGSAAGIEVVAKTKLRIVQTVKGEFLAGSGLCIQMEVAPALQTGERVRIQDEAAYYIDTASFMTKINQMNNTWKLDGNRRLDGGRYTL